MTSAFCNACLHWQYHCFRLILWHLASKVNEGCIWGGNPFKLCFFRSEFQFLSLSDDIIASFEKIQNSCFFSTKISLLACVILTYKRKNDYVWKSKVRVIEKLCNCRLTKLLYVIYIIVISLCFGLAFEYLLNYNARLKTLTVLPSNKKWSIHKKPCSKLRRITKLNR